METNSYVVAVRELCEFAAKEGDLDSRFTPAPTALEGNEGHLTVAARRGLTRQSEVPLSATVGRLIVRGRADGYDVAQGVLDEVKTFKGDLDRMPASHRALHWAQAKVYAALLCEQMQVPQLRVCLVYFEIGTGKETVFEQECSAAELWSLLSKLCDRFWQWAQHELEHRTRRRCLFEARCVSRSVSFGKANAHWPSMSSRHASTQVASRSKPALARARRSAPCFQRSKPSPPGIWTRCSF